MTEEEKEGVTPPEELKIKQLEEELKEAKDKYLRNLAEMENARKRMIKEKQDTSRFVIENLVSEFLTPMDNFENALNYTEGMGPEVKNWAMGFQMILTQFKDVLHQNGIAPFKSEGAFFDPYLHEAVETEETEEQPEGMILQEFIRGYKCGERIIRPAKVKVAKSPTKVEKTEEKGEN